MTPFAIICARIYYVAFSWEYYVDNPISMLYIWEGGIAIYGGVIGAIIGKGGETINKITSETGAEVNIDEEGLVTISGKASILFTVPRNVLI